MGAVSLPLKWKIIGTNTFLLLVTIVLLVQFASSLFNEDKAATIYETTLEDSLSLAERFQVYGAENQRTFDLILKLASDRSLKADFLKTVFSKNPSIVAVAHWDSFKSKSNKRLNFFLENDLFVGNNTLKKSIFLEVMENLEGNQKAGQRIISAVDLNKIPGLENFSAPLLQIFWQEGESKMQALFHLEKPLKELSRKSSYDHYIWWQGQLLHTVQSGAKSYERNLRSLLNNHASSTAQVKELEVSKKDSYLVAISPIATGAFALSVIEEDVIFKASSFLRKQSFYFGLFILALTIFVGVLMSRGLTTNLARLHEASLAFAQGDFQQDLPVKSRDEIGNLASTFKKMGQDILRYVEEMKDKARMEKEMEVAKLVQESFIPQEELSFHQLKLSSYYRPTSECSGDWWGSFSFGETLVLVVADATGHGVPAALMTATASGCLHQLEYELLKGLRNSLTASEVLKVMNFSLARMGGKIHMTAFSMVVDTKTGKATYANASHNPPLFLPKGLQGSAAHPFSKDQLVPLMEAQGARLGEKIDADYQDKAFQLEEGDYLFIYSDGLVEQVDDEGKAWGQRRFMKELLGYLNEGHSHQALTGLPRFLLEKLQEFSNRQNWDDDITLLSIGYFDGELSKVETSRYQFLEEDKILISSLDNDKIYGELFDQFDFRGVWTTSETWQEFRAKVQGDLISHALVEYGNEIHAQEFLVSQTEQIEKDIIPFIESLNDDGYFSSPKGPFSLMARELVSNALYHQQEDTSEKSRTGGLILPKDKAISVILFQREEGLGLVVKDQSGRLTYEGLRSALKRAYVEKSPLEKEGGAGLGLYMVFENANKVFFDVTLGESTTILALIEKEKRYKKYKSKTTQFYFREQRA